MIEKRIQKTPKNITERWDTRVEAVAQRLYSKRKDLFGALGEAPYRAKKASDEQMQEDYLAVRDNVEGWKGVLADAVKTTNDGRVLIRKDFLESIKAQEHKLKKGQMQDMHALLQEVTDGNSSPA